ncbi:unnamed protein product [Discula destructiva]
MKWSLILTAALLPAAAVSRFVSKRDDVTTTDAYLFSISLSDFVSYRDSQNPATLNWASDGCTDSPDNPLGFDYEPACYRHDFGYTNYRLQGRFTESAKESIDSNFLSDLKTQCDDESVFLRGLCDALAEVYYTAVKAFGGDDAAPGKRGNSNLVAEYDAKLAHYDALVAEAKAEGLVQ